MPQPTPLNDITARAGARFTEVAGFHLPADFRHPDIEYQSAIRGTVVFDYSHAAKLELTGPDAPQFLHNISTNDIKSLPLGGGCETYFCDARAKALFVAWVYHLRLADTRNALWIETTPERNESLLRHLDRFLISEAVAMADVTHQFAQLHVAGPGAKSVLETALGAGLPDLVEFQHMERTFGATGTCSIRKRTPLGVPGYDLVCLNERAEGVWRAVTAAGATPAGMTTYETLRVEAGTPVYGVDVDDSRFVMEIGNAPRAVSYAKGCFPGQEPIVMARDRAGRVNRSFLGIKSLAGEVPPGSKLLKDGQVVGLVTSSAQSPRLGAPLALGYVHWKYTQTGTHLDADTPVGAQPVVVIGYPPALEIECAPRA